MDNMNENNLNNVTQTSTFTTTEPPVTSPEQTPSNLIEPVSEPSHVEQTVTPVITPAQVVQTKPVTETSVNPETKQISEVNSNMPQGESLPINNAPNNNKKRLFILLGVAVLIVAVVLILIFSLGGNKKDESKPSDELKDKIEEQIKLEEKVVVETQKLPNKYILITAKNDNKSTISVEVTINFYNKENKLIDTKDTYVTPIASGSIGYNYIVIMNDFEYERFEINYKVEDAPYYQVLSNDKIEIIDSKTEEALLVQIKNKTKEVIGDVRINVIYYKDNQIVGYDYDVIYGFRAEGEETEKFYNPEDEENEDIAYDRYEIVAVLYNTTFEN